MYIKEPSRPGLYLHIPFCRHKCGYCDFYSVAGLQYIKTFVSAICKEISSKKELSGRLEFDTIYLGGGTPSLLEAVHLEQILETIHAVYQIRPNTEVTMEINPGSLTDGKLNDFSSLGVNRLSIGAQSFDQRELDFLERIHSVHDIYNTVKSARRAGIDRLALDLIFGLPGQTIETWQANLRYAVELIPEHISAYNLTLEEGTPFQRRLKSGETMISGDERSGALFLETVRFLTGAGYTPYEISNYARTADLISRHNVKYWFHIPYLGFGPSAHSFWNNRRWKNVSDLNGYLRRIESGSGAVEETEELTRDDLEFEFIMLGLRTYQGVDLNKFKSVFGYDFEETYKKTIDELILAEKGDFHNGYFRLNREGMLICDEIITRFYH